MRRSQRNLTVTCLLKPNVTFLMAPRGDAARETGHRCHVTRRSGLRQHRLGWTWRVAWGGRHRVSVLPVAHRDRALWPALGLRGTTIVRLLPHAQRARGQPALGPAARGAGTYRRAQVRGRVRGVCTRRCRHISGVVRVRRTAPPDPQHSPGTGQVPHRRGSRLAVSLGHHQQ